MEISTVHDLDELRDAWQDVAARTDNIFATWEWAHIWWRHFGRGRPTVLVVRIAGEVRGIIPLYVWRSRPLRVVRFIGHGPADQLGIICDPNDWAVMVGVLREFLKDQMRPDLFLGDVLPGRYPWAEELGGVSLVVENSPAVDVAGRDWPSFLSSRSRNFRGQLLRRERRLSAQGNVTFHQTIRRESLGSDLDHLFELHHDRWKSATGFSRAEAFHRDFAEVALENGWLRLWILELDAKPVAAWYGFRYGTTYGNYQQGRDLSLPDVSLGAVLLSHTLRQATEEGVATYALLRGGEAYKYRWADRDESLLTIGVAPSAAGGLALRGFALASGFVGKLKRRRAPEPFAAASR